jgi:hypothetical protein
LHSCNNSFGTPQGSLALFVEQHPRPNGGQDQAALPAPWKSIVIWYSGQSFYLIILIRKLLYGIMAVKITEYYLSLSQAVYSPEEAKAQKRDCKKIEAASFRVIVDTL